MIMWNLERADKEFSLYIRRRDRRCMNPLCPNGYSHGAPIAVLENSHFWPRGDLIARFDPENCIALCHDCHVMWENNKQGKYREVMIRWLGYRKYKALQKRVEDYKYKNIPHMTLSGAIKACREFLTHEKGKTTSSVS
jgi:hypothetical protein